MKTVLFVLGFFALLFVGCLLFSGCERKSEIVVLQPVVISIPAFGTHKYGQYRATADAFVLECAGRMWNKYPEERYWLKKYIEAWGDKGFKISMDQKIGFNVDDVDVE